MTKGCTFTVEGRGRFPVDMLRYDRCFPASSEAAVALADSDWKGSRQIALISDYRQPTEPRWESFGWRVIAKQPIR